MKLDASSFMRPKGSQSWRLSLLNAALFLLVASFLLVWIFIALDLQRIHDRAFQYARTELQNLTKLYAEEVSSSIASIDYVLIDLREEWNGNPLAFDTLVLFRQAHLDPRVAFNVGIIDANGILIYTSSDWNVQPIELSDREHFKFHYFNRGDGLYISEPVLLRAVHRLAIQFTRPLPAARGDFNGVIVVSVSPEYFSRFHETIDLGKDGSIALAKMHGSLLARHPEPDLVLGKRITDIPWNGAAYNGHGVFRKHSEVDRIERLYAWRRLEEKDLVVVMGRSIDTILSPYHQQRRTYLAWGIAATAFLLLTAYAIGRHQIQAARSETKLQRMEEALIQSQKLESIGKLTGGVAHDFNNILQILSSNVQLLHMTATDNQQIEFHLKSMSDAIERGSKLVSRLMTFARRQPLHPTIVDLPKLIQNIDVLIQGLVGQDIRITTAVAAGVWKVEVDQSLLEHVIFNLAANARDAMGGRGTLSISMSNESINEDRATDYPGIAPGDYVMMAISDTGPGMAPEVAAHAFEPFFTTKPEGKGTGLGLATAYGFVKESGGHICIDSEKGKGTTVKIFLPRAAPS